MNLNFTAIDVVLIVVILFGAFIGFKKGLINNIISFIGVIIAIMIAWYLKNPISEFMYTSLPFFSFKGETALINIIIYELIAFLLIATILLIILKLIVKVTGLIDKILSVTTTLGFISKILGFAFGFIETYVLSFIVLFILYHCTGLYNEIDNSVVASRMLNSTPVLSKFVEGESKSLQEISDLKDIYKVGTDEYNEHLFETLIKYNVIDTKTAKKLVEKDKVKVPNALDIINKYEK